MRNVLFLLAILSTALSLSSQEVVNSILFPQNLEGGSGLFLTDKLVEDSGRLYLEIGVPGSSLPYVDFDVDASAPGGHYIFEYEYSKGMVDYTIVNAKGVNADFAIDGEHISLYTNNFWGGIDGEFFFFDSLEERRRQDIIVYDKLHDTILYHYEDNDVQLIDGEDASLQWQAIGLHEDYVYYATTFDFEQTFMGDTLKHLNNLVGIQYTTILHKINWRTGKKEWSRHMGAIDCEDRVEEIKVVDDGSIVLHMKINGPFTWERDTLDPPHFVGGGCGDVGWYNRVVAKVSQEGDLLSHIHLKTLTSKAFQNVQIEDNGNVYAYGLLSAGSVIEVGEDTISFGDEEVTNGIVFALDEDLNVRWYKNYKPDDFAYVTGVNENKAGEVVVGVLFSDKVEAEGAEYISDFEEELGSQSLIIHYDKEGELVTDPMKVGKRDLIRDVVEVLQDRYVIVTESLMLEGEQSYFFNEPIGDRNGASNWLLEVEGLFGEITATTSEYKTKMLKVYPNPAQQGAPVRLTLPHMLLGETITITISDMHGRVRQQIVKHSSTADLNLDTLLVEQGMYLISIVGNQYNSSTTLVVY